MSCVLCARSVSCVASALINVYMYAALDKHIYMYSHTCIHTLTHTPTHTHTHTHTHPYTSLCSVCASTVHVS